MSTKHLLFSTLASLSLLLVACGDDTEGSATSGAGGNSGTGGEVKNQDLTQQ